MDVGLVEILLIHATFTVFSFNSNLTPEKFQSKRMTKLDKNTFKQGENRSSLRGSAILRENAKLKPKCPTVCAV